MQFKTVIPLLLAAAPSLVAATGTLGFCLGDVLTNNNCKQQSDYESDMQAIKSLTSARIVRTYSSSDCNTSTEILPAAASQGFQVVLGMWPDTDESFNADMAAIQAINSQYYPQLYAVTVGSETLYRGNFTGPQLMDKINQVKAILPGGVKIGTADSYNKFADGTADAVIQGGVDILLINGFAYWQGATIDAAPGVYFDDMYQAFGHIQQTNGSLSDIELWTGETGWPTDGGSDYESAQAGTSNAAQYWSQAVCGMLDWGTNVFYFEAFDETQKPNSVGLNGQPENEQHWGAMTDQRQLKGNFSLSC